MGKWGRGRRGRQLSDGLKLSERGSFGTERRVDCDIHMKHNSLIQILLFLLILLLLLLLS